MPSNIDEIMFEKWASFTDRLLKLTLKNIMQIAQKEREDFDKIATIVAYASLELALKSQIIGGCGSEELRALCDQTIDSLITKDEDILAFFKTTGEKN